MLLSPVHIFSFCASILLVLETSFFAVYDAAGVFSFPLLADDHDDHDDDDDDDDDDVWTEVANIFLLTTTK